MLIRFSVLASTVLLLSLTALPTLASPAEPETISVTCPEGSVWDSDRKKCVPAPRGSHGW